MKKTVKILSVAIAVLLVFAVATTAFAATSLTNEGAVGSASAPGWTYNMPKEIVPFNTASENIFEPNITYTYTITNGAIGESVTDANGNTANIKAGVTGGLYFTSTNNQTGTIVFGGDSAPADVATNQEGSAITSSSAVITKNITLGVNPSVFGTMPGIYRYVITEDPTGSVAAYATSGVEQGAFQDQRYVDVYVRWNQAGTALECYGMTMFVANNSIEHDSTDPDPDFKVTGYDLATEGDDVDTYHTYNLTVEKQVDGALADKNNEFPFMVDIDAGAATAVEFYADGDYTNTHLTFTNGDYVLNPNYASSGTDLTLKHGDNVTFYGLPIEATATVAEKDNTVDTYTATADMNGDDVTMNNTAANKTWSTDADAVAYCDDEANCELTVTNTLDEVSPTGIVTRFAPYVIMLAAGIILIAVTRRKRAESIR